MMSDECKDSPYEAISAVVGNAVSTRPLHFASRSSFPRVLDVQSGVLSFELLAVLHAPGMKTRNAGLMYCRPCPMLVGERRLSIFHARSP